MPVARFSNFPPLEYKGLSGAFDPHFLILKKYYFSLPKPIKKLFSFNTRTVVFDQLFSWWMDSSPHGCMDYDLPGEKASIILTPDGIEQTNVYKLLFHELSHTLDPCCYKNSSFTAFPNNHFPDWINQKEVYQRWMGILKKEPRSTEISNRPGSLARRSWMKRPSEQWACRMGITLIADYLVPAGLMKANNVALDNDLSVASFKSKWPKSYKFFRNYIKIILAHAPKSNRFS